MDNKYLINNRIEITRAFIIIVLHAVTSSFGQQMHVCIFAWNTPTKIKMRMNVLFEMKFFALLTWDHQFHSQTAVNKYTYHHLSHQQKLDQCTNIRQCYPTKSSTKIAFSIGKTRVEKKTLNEKCRLIRKKILIQI